MTLNYVTRWFGPQRIHNPLCQRCVVISLVRKTRSQANKRLSCANMAKNALKEPRNTAKSPYCWDMMRLLDNARKEGELMLLCEWKEKHSPLTDVFWQPVANFFKVYLPTI